jgi:hypothetical protein
VHFCEFACANASGRVHAVCGAKRATSRKLAVPKNMITTSPAALLASLLLIMQAEQLVLVASPNDTSNRNTDMSRNSRKTTILKRTVYLTAL